MPDFEKSGKGVTPLSKGMKYQKLSSPKEYKGTDKLKKYKIVMNGRVMEIDYDGNGGVIIDGKVYNTTVKEETENSYLASVEVTKKQIHDYKIIYNQGLIFMEGKQVEFSFQPAVPKLIRKRSNKSGTEEIRAPLPGIIVSIPVKVGDEVKSGQVVTVLEAMKMQNDIICNINGHIKEICIEVGTQAETDQLLLIIKSTDTSDK